MFRTNFKSSSFPPTVSSDPPSKVKVASRFFLSCKLTMFYSTSQRKVKLRPGTWTEIPVPLSSQSDIG